MVWEDFMFFLGQCSAFSAVVAHCEVAVQQKRMKRTSSFFHTWWVEPYRFRELAKKEIMDEQYPNAHALVTTFVVEPYSVRGDTSNKNSPKYI